MKLALHFFCYRILVYAFLITSSFAVILIFCLKQSGEEREKEPEPEPEREYTPAGRALKAKLYVYTFLN